MDSNFCVDGFGISEDTEICQYLDLDYFLGILLTGKYCVRQKQDFVDKRESNIFSKAMFPLRPAKEYNLPDDPSMGTLAEMDKKLKEFAETGSYYTSCWTLDATDKFFMWQTYTSKFGIRMRSTVGDFIHSLNSCEYYNSVWCTKINYKKVNFYDNLNIYLTTKDTAFADERELRFYFLKEPIDTDKMETCPNRKIFIPINSQRMIKDVIISPFVSAVYAKWLIEHLEAEFQIKAQQSEIKLNK